MTEDISMPSRSTALPPFRILSVLVWVAIGFIALCMGIVYTWATDNEPPFRLKNFTIDSEARVGKAVRVTMYVERDMNRRCDVVISRFVQDSKGYRSYTDSQALSSMDIERLEVSTPGVAKVNVGIPAAASPGLGTIGTALQYTCNPLHKFFPIYVTLAIPVEITEAPK